MTPWRGVFRITWPHRSQDCNVYELKGEEGEDGRTGGRTVLSPSFAYVDISKIRKLFTKETLRQDLANGASRFSCKGCG